jgi:hypothetical protein
MSDEANRFKTDSGGGGGGGPKDYINIKLYNSNDSAEVHIKIKMNANLGEVVTKYCAKRGVPEGSLRFLFESTRIVDGITPKMLEMVEGDAIEIFQTQLGGGSM